MSSTVDCDPPRTNGRRRKMEGFAAAAEALTLFDAQDDPDITDALVSLRINAGIAAADVICCRRLGRHSVGTNHNDAVALLRKVDKTLANHLRRLLQIKPKAQYGALSVSGVEVKTSERSTNALLAAAREP